MPRGTRRIVINPGERMCKRCSAILPLDDKHFGRYNNLGFKKVCLVCESVPLVYQQMAPTSTPPRPIEEHSRILVINLNTNRARYYDVEIGSRAQAIVPTEAQAYAEFVRGAQSAGYTVVIEV